MLRRIRSHRLVAVLCLVALLAGTAVASGAIGGSGAKPPPKPLPVAVRDALGAKPVAGITARIKFVNRLVSTDALPQGTTSPLITGATGRAWLAADGRFRLELQSENGDAQIVSDGRRVTVFDGKANKLYTLALPKQRTRGHEKGHDRVPSLRAIRRALTRLAQHANVSGAIPANVAGRPAYSVSVSPKHDAGLLGAASLAWDAANGVPLRIALTAQGSDQPVLELEATDISYGAISGSDLVVPSPPGAKHVRVKLPSAGAHSRHRGKHERSITGTRAVAAKLPFRLVAPRRLVGLPRQDVRLVSETGSAPRALVLYGHGLGGIAVLESPTKPSKRESGLGQLPKVSVNGATGHELPTALGTLLTWDSGGVTYTLVGSLPAAAAETAARDFAGGR